MTFVATETSRTLGEPIELYTFMTAGVSYNYTNADDDWTVDGVTYSAVPIKRTNITSSGALDKATLTVSIAESVPFAALLRDRQQNAVISLRIRQGHASDPDKQFLVAWAGRVVSSKGGQSVRDVSCQPVSTSLRRNGLRRNWQLGCPHVLYGDRCRASRAAVIESGLVTAINGNIVTFQPGWARQADRSKYAGGYVQYDADGTVRTIIASSGETVTLSGKITFPVGTRVGVLPGCDHTTTDCKGVHKPSDEADYGGGNIHNFGGMPFIPQKSPIGFVSNY